MNTHKTCIQFYHIGMPQKRAFPSFLKLIIKLFDENNPLLLLYPSSESLLAFSELLWNYAYPRFLGHLNFLQMPSKKNWISFISLLHIEKNVLIEEYPFAQQSVWLNFGSEFLLQETKAKPQRFIECLWEDPKSKKAARERYKYYQKGDWDLSYQALKSEDLELFF